MAVCAVAAAASLAGCQLLNAVTEPIDLYTVTPKSTFDPDLPAVYWQLAVEAPAAAANLNTGRIAIALTPTSTDYYANAAWTDRAPLMVQTRIVDSFENTQQDRRGVPRIDRASRQLRAATRPAQLRGALLLRQAADRAGAHHRQARAYARPADHRRRLVRALRAGARRQIPKVVEAFDQALGSVIKRLVAWTLRTPPPRAPSESAPSTSSATATRPTP